MADPKGHANSEGIVVLVSVVSVPMEQQRTVYGNLGVYLAFTGDFRLYLGKLKNIVVAWTVLTVMYVSMNGQQVHQGYASPEYWETVVSWAWLSLVAGFIWLCLAGLALAIVLIGSVESRQDESFVLAVPYILFFFGVSFVFSCSFLVVYAYKDVAIKDILVRTDASLLCEVLMMLLVALRTDFYRNFQYPNWARDQIVSRVLYAAVALPVGLYVIEPNFDASPLSTFYGALDSLALPAVGTLICHSCLSLENAPRGLGAKASPKVILA